MILSLCPTESFSLPLQSSLGLPSFVSLISISASFASVLRTEPYLMITQYLKRWVDVEEWRKGEPHSNYPGTLELPSDSLCNPSAPRPVYLHTCSTDTSGTWESQTHIVIFPRNHGPSFDVFLLAYQYSTCILSTTHAPTILRGFAYQSIQNNSHSAKIKAYVSHSISLMA